MTSDEVAEVIGAATIAALTHHAVEPTGGERGKLLQGLGDERQVRLDLRAPRRRIHSRQAGLGQHPHHRAMVHVQLPRDSVDAPLLDVMIAQDLRFEFRGNGHLGFSSYLATAADGAGSRCGRTADSDIHTNDSATIPGGDRGIALPRDAMTLPPAEVAMPLPPLNLSQTV